MPEIKWQRFDYDDKANTKPPADRLVWIVEEYYAEGVTLGSVSHWALIDYPAVPAGETTQEETA
jgi:hypothetical protein